MDDYALIDFLVDSKTDIYSMIDKKTNHYDRKKLDVITNDLKRGIKKYYSKYGDFPNISYDELFDLFVNIYCMCLTSDDSDNKNLIIEMLGTVTK